MENVPPQQNPNEIAPVPPGLPAAGVIQEPEKRKTAKKKKANESDSEEMLRPTKKVRRSDDPKVAFLQMISEMESSLCDTPAKNKECVLKLVALINGKSYIRTDELPKKFKATWAESNQTKQDAASLFKIAREFAEKYRF